MSQPEQLRLGILLWGQATDWPAVEQAAARVDELGYDHLWAWDHLHAIFGEPQQPIFEGWLTVTAWAKVTRRARLGLLVGANTFRNPGLVAKLATTLDHISEGRAILGLGGAWFEYEHTAHGIDFGASPGERLRWLDEAASAVRTVLDGGSATSPEGGRYRFSDLRQEPLPVQPKLPLMIGGSGERKTLRTVARLADMWNGMGTFETMQRKVTVLEQHCAEVGRDTAEIERTIGCKPLIRDSEAEARRALELQLEHNREDVTRPDRDPTFWPGTPEQIAERLLEMGTIGFHTAIAELAAPYDYETIERLIGQVKPMVDRG
ncbi:MAG TPA: LLM class flavin-dependent oxidoreductase [Candidatus Limnocylindrales bacterium]|nr:LLM class flavin-dependent oxidoreductase [Candidatus Limnocylindrales bacterium]